MTISRQEMEALAEKVIGFSNAERIAVNLASNRTGNTRFAANQLTTSGSVENANVVVQSWYGPRHAVVTTNNLSDESLKAAVERSEADTVRERAHRVVRDLGHRLVDQQHQDSAERQRDPQDERGSAETERVRPADGSARHADRPQVE